MRCLAMCGASKSIRPRPRSRQGAPHVGVASFALIALCGALRTAFASNTASEALVEETLLVPANGKEVFSDKSLEADAYYDITVRAVVPMSCSGGLPLPSRPCQGDAVYREDRWGHFAERHGCLTFNAPATLVEEDRAEHTYRFQLSGTASRLSVHFDCPSAYPSDRVLYTFLVRSGQRLPFLLIGSAVAVVALGIVVVRMAVRAADRARQRAALEEAADLRRTQELALRQSQEAGDRARKKAVAKFLGVLQEVAKVNAAEEARLRKEREDDEDFVRNLAVYELLPALEDPAVIEGAARRQPEQWAAQKPAILSELRALHSNPRRLELLKARYPRSYERLLFNAKALNLSFYILAGAPLPGSSHLPPPSDPPPAEQTPQETREIAIERLRVAGEDQIAFERTRHNLLQMAKEMFAADGMPEDEIVAGLQDVEGAIREAALKKRGNTDVSIQKL